MDRQEALKIVDGLRAAQAAGLVDELRGVPGKQKTDLARILEKILGA
jgi:hypothetical protein